MWVTIFNTRISSKQFVILIQTQRICSLDERTGWTGRTNFWYQLTKNVNAYEIRTNKSVLIIDSLAISEKPFLC